MKIDYDSKLVIRLLGLSSSCYGLQMESYRITNELNFIGVSSSGISRKYNFVWVFSELCLHKTFSLTLFIIF